MVVTEIYSLSRESECLIPLYSNPVCCGFPSPADDYVEQLLDLNEHLIERPAASFLVRAIGDSMIAAGIKSGDLLLVDKSLTPRDGDVVIAEVDGQFMVKRYSDTRGRLRLVTENPQHPPVKIGEDTEVNIWGVVLHVIHSFRSPSNGRSSR